jgi:predicted nuclease with TOPRIM domain
MMNKMHEKSGTIEKLNQQYMSVQTDLKRLQDEHSVSRDSVTQARMESERLRSRNEELSFSLDVLRLELEASKSTVRRVIVV